MNIKSIRKIAGSELLTVLAHEIRTPLAVILTTLELIKAEGVDPKKTRKHLENVRTRASMISGLIDELLGDSHIPHDASTFTLKDKAVRQNKDLSERSARSPVERLKVLIVDDDSGAADALGQLLVMRGFDVGISYSGEDALKKTLTFSPTVAILDIGMPEMDGYELVGKLRERKVECTYIALTGFGRINDKKKALNAGFDHHFTKPAGLKELQAVLRKVGAEMKKETSK